MIDQRTRRGFHRRSLVGAVALVAAVIVVAGPRSTATAATADSGPTATTTEGPARDSSTDLPPTITALDHAASSPVPSAAGPGSPAADGPDGNALVAPPVGSGPREADPSAGRRPAALPPGWSQTQLAPGSTTGSDGQGTAVALGVDGSGTPFAAVSNGGGEVLVYGQDVGGSEAWGLAATITASGASSHFGWALSFADGNLAVGDPNGGSTDICGNQQGEVYVFALGSTVATWTQTAKVTARGSLNNLGSSVSISATTLVAGGPGEDSCRYISIKGASPELVAIWDLSDLTAEPTTFTNRELFGSSGALSGLGRAVAQGPGVVFASAPYAPGVCMMVDTAASGDPPSWAWKGCWTYPGIAPGSVEFLNPTVGQSIAYSATTGQLLVGVPDPSYYSCSNFGCSISPAPQTTTCVYSPGEVVVLSAPSGFSASSPTPLTGWVQTTIEPGIPDVTVTHTGSNIWGSAKGCPQKVFGEFDQVPPEGSAFGQAVALDPSGSTAIIGMPADSGSGQANTTWAYAFDASVNATNLLDQGAAGATPTAPFTVEGSFAPDGMPSAASYGSAVAALDGPGGGLAQVAVGAPKQGSTGFAYVFADVGRPSVGLSIDQTAPVPPARPSVGDAVAYTATLSTGPVPAPSPTFVAYLPAGLTITSVAATAGDTGFACYQIVSTGYSEAVCEYVGGTYPGASSTTFTIDTTTADARAGDTYPVYATAVLQGDVAWTYASTATTFTGDTTLTTSVTQNPASGTVVPGGSATYDVTVTNGGASVAVAPEVTLTGLVADPADPPPSPPTLTVESAPAQPVWSCTSPASTPSCSAAGLAPGATARFTLVVTVSPDTPVGSTFTPTATVTWGNPAGSSASAATTTTVDAGAPTTLGITATPASTAVVSPGQTPTVGLTVTNTGGTAGAVTVAADPTLTGPVSGITGATLTAEQPGWTCSPWLPPSPGGGPAVPATCSTASLPAGASASFVLAIGTAAVDAPVQGLDVSTLAVTGTVTWANGPGGSVGTASASTSLPVGGALDVAVTQAAKVSVGGYTDATVTVTNRGAGPMSGVSVDLSLVGLEERSAPTTGTPGWSCAALGCSLADGATLEAGAAVVISLGVTPTREAAEIVVTGRYGIADGPDVVESVTGRIEVSVIGNVSMVASTARLVLDADGTGRFTATGTNHGPDPAPGVHVVLSMPAGLQLRSLTLPNGATVDPATGTASAAPMAASGPTWTCTRTSSSAVDCAGEADLVSGVPQPFAATVVAGPGAAPGAELGRITVTISSSGADADPADDTATIDVVAAGSEVAAPTAPTASGTLPATGNDRGRLVGQLALGLALVVAGSVLVARTRRRRASRR